MDSVLLQKQIRDNAQDLANYLQELKNWEFDMKRKESELQATASGDSTCPPVRSKMKKSLKCEKGGQEKLKDKVTKMSSHDYSSWDRYDADKACEELDNEGQQVSEEEGESTGNNDKEEKLREEALYEKGRGNDFVRNQKWKDAIQCYSRAIKCYSHDAIFYANRALCYLKTENHKAAETDCTTALQLDSSYVKAYQRRAMARVALGQLQEARTDLLKVMELEPKNMASKGELVKLEKKIGSRTPEKVTVREAKSETQCKNISDQKIEENIQLKPHTSQHIKISNQKPKNIENENRESCKENEKDLNRKVSQNQSNKIIEITEMEKQNNREINHKNLEQQNENSKSTLQKDLWSNEKIKLLQPIYKPPHLRSKKPLKRVEIKEVNFADTEHNIGKGTFSHKTSFEEKNSGTSSNLNRSITNENADKVIEGNSRTLVSAVEDHTSRNIAVEESQNSQTESCVEHIPPIPLTSVQFLVGWKKVKANSQLCYLFLKQICGEDLPKIFGDSLESDILSDMIYLMKTRFLQAKESPLPYLIGLTNVRRFSALVMFMSEDDKAGVKIILDKCNEEKACSEEEIADLMKKYGIC